MDLMDDNNDDDDKMSMRDKFLFLSKGFVPYLMEKNI